MKKLIIFLLNCLIYVSANYAYAINVMLAVPIELKINNTSTAWIIGKEDSLAEDEYLIGKLRWSFLQGTSEKIVMVEWIGLQTKIKPYDIVYFESHLHTLIHTHQTLLLAGQVVNAHGKKSHFDDAINKLHTGSFEHFEEKDPKLLNSLGNVFTGILEKLFAEENGDYITENEEMAEYNIEQGEHLLITEQLKEKIKLIT